MQKHFVPIFAIPSGATSVTEWHGVAISETLFTISIFNYRPGLKSITGFLSHKEL